MQESFPRCCTIPRSDIVFTFQFRENIGTDTVLTFSHFYLQPRELPPAHLSLSSFREGFKLSHKKIALRTHSAWNGFRSIWFQAFLQRQESVNTDMSVKFSTPPDIPTCEFYFFVFLHLKTDCNALQWNTRQIHKAQKMPKLVTLWKIQFGKIHFVKINFEK